VETVVLLFTDVEGSTRAWATSPGMVRSLERHDALLRDALASHGGIEFKHTGDGLCATFPSVADAVLAAIDAQRALESADWEDGPALRVRVAIHAGTAHRRGDDWFGLSLSRCARLMGAAHGGQVLVSSAAGTLLAEAPAEGATVVDLGRVILRDCPEPEQVGQVVAPELDTEFPPLRAAAAQGNLPADLSPIIGRNEAIAQVCAAVLSRLVTLPGREVLARRHAAARDAGIRVRRRGWLVELASAQVGERSTSWSPRPRGETEIRSVRGCRSKRRSARKVCSCSTTANMLARSPR
jgi:class 3 adenylate cyclase